MPRLDWKVEPWRGVEEAKRSDSEFRRGAVDAVGPLLKLEKRVHWDLDVVQRAGMGTDNQSGRGHCQTGVDCEAQSTMNLVGYGYPSREWSYEADSATRQKVDRQREVLNSEGNSCREVMRRALSTPWAGKVVGASPCM